MPKVEAIRDYELAHVDEDDVDFELPSVDQMTGPHIGLMPMKGAVQPTRWFYGFFGVWLAQMFAFTPIAFMILRGVVQGVSPSMEEAAQTLRASRWQTFATVTLPLLKPGLANAFLVGFIESMADFGNPIILGGSHAVLSTEIFFAIVGASLDPGMAAALALLLTAFALGVFALQQRVLAMLQAADDERFSAFVYFSPRLVSFRTSDETSGTPNVKDEPRRQPARLLHQQEA